MTPCRCLMLLILALTVVGCGSSSKDSTGPIPPGAEFRTGLPLEPGYAQQFGYTTRWARSIALGDGQSIFAAKPVGDLLMVVERPDNVVTALKLDNGEMVWKTIVGESLEQLYAPVGNDEIIFVNSGRRLFSLNRRNGNLINVDNLPFPVTMSPILVDDIAIFGSVNGKVYGYTIKNGYRKWTYSLRGRIMNSPIVKDDTIFATDSTGYYAVLATKTGELRWRGETYGPITAATVLDGDYFIVASDDQSLYSLQDTTGEDRWPAYRSEVPLSNTPAVLGGQIYVVEPGRGLTALNSSTGKPRWNIEQPLQPVSEIDGKVVAHHDKTLAIIDPATGKVIDEVPTRELDTIKPGPDNSLLLVTPGGDILRIDPR